MKEENRIRSIDIVRGAVMIIMALDHTRDLLHNTALTQSPTDLATTTPFLFFTRWITHLCAPTFVFLSGLSVYLSSRRTKNFHDTRNFLVKRGLWLIALEFTLINFALWFDFQFRILMLQVIAAIGVGLIVLAGLLKLNATKIGIAGAIILLTHNLLPLLPGGSEPALILFRKILFEPGLLQVTSDFSFFIAYPLVPWVAIMLLGYSCGQIYDFPPAQRQRYQLNVAVGFLFLFVLARLVNVYGDPVPWLPQKNATYSLLSFLNLTKYPPSLLFVLLFLGITFFLLRFADNFPAWLRRILSVYGKVPLFYYLLHFYLIRLSVFIMVFSQGFSWSDLLFGPFQFGRPASGSGISLSKVYLVWLIIVVLLYPVCKWYGEYKIKSTHKWWVRYL